MHYRDKTGMCVLVPHWFDDTVRLGIRGLPTDECEWPYPRVFKPETSTDGAVLDVPYRLSSEKKRFYETALASSFDRRLSRLSASQRDAHEEGIRREGDVIVPLSLIGSGTPLDIAQEEARQVQQADVLITRYRALKAKKTIGSMTWLWHVRSTGAPSRPTDKLLHYPIPKGAPEGFAEHSITITNYTGKDREYLKKLVSTMDGKFTASMSNTNTIVIAAYVGGTKTAKALSRSIPLVNHTWLEDAFVHWRTPTPAREKYLCFPPGVDFGGLLERGVGPLEPPPPQCRTESVRAAAPEASVQFPTKRGRPSGFAKRAASSVSFQPPTEDSTTITTAPVPAALMRTPSRRSAATKATGKLHEEIMPDVINFQKEMKKSTVRSVWEAEEKDESKSAGRRCMGRKSRRSSQ
ncbi:hypothetical protein SCP_1103140 [Sparassis crispa]|uniref:BRCT domain-containing protein n=1 Tax=Sparassis crispa TaxID=139825 RepID=A0A401GZP2_9APHY|nr:hypothetical protein SCP_1103140 [Sparassis crispa]GBE87637.1 hypothetical protein SCP_1103140 [Sparassis crispa]